MARTYTLQFCDDCRLNVMLCRCGGEAVHSVTVYDSRDVKPLVESARQALGELGRLSCGDSEPDYDWIDARVYELSMTLAPFKSGTQS